MINVVEYYANKSIFITGATGFMGKVLVEKLLRSCPDLKVIYLLVRKKKGQTAEERLNNFMSSRVFEKLLEINPLAFKKLCLISGDILEEALGISIQDLDELQKECEIVINNAACVSFDLPLQEAVKFNTIGTQKILQLANTMRKLEVFVHVSTSFCHDDVNVLEDKLYPSLHDPSDVIKAISWMNDDVLKAVQPELIKPFSNTYGYTKCLTEQLIAKHDASFPIAIARPSIVLPSWKEPMEGWADNINGPGGAIYAASRGVLHSMYCKESTKVDVVPVDMVINALLILSCVTAVERPKDVRVCNITQSGVNSLTWIEGSNMWSKYLAEYPLSFGLWYPVAKAKQFKLEHQFDCFFIHTLPAYFIDLLLFLFGQKRFMVRVLKRMNHGLELIEYYNNRNWVFKNEYFKSLPRLIRKEDNEIFYTNLEDIDPEKFMKNYVKGMREFYCKEDPSTLPKAKKLHQSEGDPFKEGRLSESKGFTKVTHCLFDMDGTVLNSEVMYHKMIAKICSKYNRKYTKALQVKMYGVTDREICVTIVNELKMPISIDEFERQLTDLAQKLLPSAPVQEGAERLLTHLHDTKIPMALATNSTEQAVRLHATARPKLFGLFHHKVSVTDPEVFRGKPNPDIYLVAASRFPDKPKPKQCLVFEDSAVGVMSAKEAGMQVVMIPDKRIDREQTRQATLVLRSLLDFQPEMFGLPPFDDTPRPSSRIEK